MSGKKKKISSDHIAERTEINTKGRLECQEGSVA